MKTDRRSGLTNVRGHTLKHLVWTLCPHRPCTHRCRESVFGREPCRPVAPSKKSRRRARGRLAIREREIPNRPNFAKFWGDLASRPTPEPSAVVQRNAICSEYVLGFSRTSGLVVSLCSGARCAQRWAPSAVQMATPPPLPSAPRCPGCAGGGRMPVGDSNTLTTQF